MEQVRATYLSAGPTPRPTWYDPHCLDFGHRESTEGEKVGLGQLNQNYRTAPATLDLIDRASALGMGHLDLSHVPLEPGQPDLSSPDTAEKIRIRNSQSMVKLLLPPDVEAPSEENEDGDSTPAEPQAKPDRFNAHSLRMLAAHLRQMHTVHGVAWKDMLVLAHSFKTLLDPLQEALAVEGIPCRALVRDAVWRRQEVADLVNLIRYLADPSDNPALMGVLLGPVARLTPGEITLLAVLGAAGDVLRPNLEAGLRALANPEAPNPFTSVREEAKIPWNSLAPHRREHLQAIARRLAGSSGWRALVDRMPHHQLVRHVLQESGAWLALAAWNSCPGASPESFDRAARGIDHALERMEEMETRSPLSLREMAETLTGLMEGEIAEKVDAELGPGEDLVRVMTVHVSKGLEARVVGLLVPSVGERGNRMPVGSSLVILDRQYFQSFHPDRHGPLLGLPLFKYPDHLVDGKNQFTDETRGQTLLSMASHADQVLQAQESVRLFHVAITRSEAALFVAGSCPAANPDSYRLWPQWFCEGAWPDSSRDSVIPPKPPQAAGEKPVCHAGPAPVLPRIERPASLSVNRAEGFLTDQDDNAQDLELAHLGLQPRVRPIPADWVSGNVLRARRDTPGAVVGTLVHRGFEMGDTLPAGQDRQRFLTNMAGALLRECQARDLESGDADPASGGADLLAGQVASTAVKILSILDQEEGAEFLEILRAPGSAETDFSLRLGNWLIKGRMDRLLEDGTIIDWKTDEDSEEGIVSRYHNQMALYALALWTARGKTDSPVCVKLAMTHHAKVVPMTFTPERLRGFEATLRNRLDRAKVLAESAPA
jgi:ATP-dependent exoDNAse (exonuclease V) beta subunit